MTNYCPAQNRSLRADTLLNISAGADFFMYILRLVLLSTFLLNSKAPSIDWPFNIVLVDPWICIVCLLIILQLHGVCLGAFIIKENKG